MTEYYTPPPYTETYPIKALTYAKQVMNQFYNHSTTDCHRNHYVQAETKTVLFFNLQQITKLKNFQVQGWTTLTCNQLH